MPACLVYLRAWRSKGTPFRASARILVNFQISLSMGPCAAVGICWRHRVRRRDLLPRFASEELAAVYGHLKFCAVRVPARIEELQRHNDARQMWDFQGNRIFARRDEHAFNLLAGLQATLAPGEVAIDAEVTLEIWTWLRKGIMRMPIGRFLGSRQQRKHRYAPRRAGSASPRCLSAGWLRSGW